MNATGLAFRLNAERRTAQLAAFNARREIEWFGFEGAFAEPSTALITFRQFDPGAQGGGGTAAINGGVIAAGFDAAFVLAGLAQYDVEVVVTLELSVQFLNLARVGDGLALQAQVVRSAKNFCFVRGTLSDRAAPAAPPMALASGMVAPAR